MTSKTKTFEAESYFGEVLYWFIRHLETEEYEIITNTPPGYDVKTKLSKKYRITIQEVPVDDIAVVSVKTWAIEFATYMENSAAKYDHQEQRTHTMLEHYENFLASWK